MATPATSPPLSPHPPSLSTGESGGETRSSYEAARARQPEAYSPYAEACRALANE